MKTAPPCPVTRRDALPQQFADVADLLGDAALLRLVEAHGGTRFYVPEHAPEDGVLAELLGAEPARRLAAGYGRDTITVPLCKPWRAALLRQQGLSYAAIARKIGMHEQSVHRMLAAPARPFPVQPRLL